MFTFLASFFQRILSGEVFELVEPNSASKFIYRDELCRKKSTESSSKLKQPLIKVGKLDDQKKEIKKSSSDAIAMANENKTTIRVKVKMTKQEAARLLSKCKEGGVLEFRDVARELVDLPKDRVSFVTSSSPCPGSPAVLGSIPEEY
ncbi:hypothetical protein COLO4_10705 [Corchorus olitorius]|uniref:DUF7890 domain-containing protein n=1 Tax=Corchorus olitorius TaxID=93759 RepID=A0A1R3K772_9ROSI|nr:hypothetical protein COLO4_10705 [Corchorus olitorius]